MSIAIGSPASVDEKITKFSASHIERAAYEAAVVIEQLKKHPVKELICMGHSLGGTELAYMIPILRSLIKQNGLDTKIKGEIFIQSTGQYEQSIPGISARSGEVGSLRGEMRELFPSSVDISEAEERLQRLDEDVDMEEVLLMRTQIEEMRRKKENPPYLTEEEWTALAAMDKELEEEKDKTRRRDLVGQRAAFFLKSKDKAKPSIMQRIVAAADIRPKPILSNTDWLQVGAKIMGYDKVPVLNRVLPEYGINTALPEWLRDQVDDVLTAFLWGGKDAYMPAKEAQARQTSEAIDRMRKIKKENPELDAETVWREAQYFPHSPVVFDAEIADFPHIGVATDAPKYAKIVTDVVWRMYNDEAANKMQPGEPQKIVRLHY